MASLWGKGVLVEKERDASHQCLSSVHIDILGALQIIKSTSISGSSQVKTGQVKQAGLWGKFYEITTISAEGGLDFVQFLCKTPLSTGQGVASSHTVGSSYRQLSCF